MDYLIKYICIHFNNVRVCVCLCVYVSVCTCVCVCVHVRMCNGKWQAFFTCKMLQMYGMSI